MSSIQIPARPVSADNRTVSAHVSGSSPKPFSKSPCTGSGVAAQISCACANASSRLTVPPSGRPRVNACAADDVAKAFAPMRAIIFAYPASQTLPKINGSPLTCSARNVSPICVIVYPFKYMSSQMPPDGTARRYRRRRQWSSPREYVRQRPDQSFLRAWWQSFPRPKAHLKTPHH